MIRRLLCLLLGHTWKAYCMKWDYYGDRSMAGQMCLRCNKKRWV